MKFHVLTLFPEMVENGLNTSITGRAIEAGQISITATNIRDFTEDKHKRVDDYSIGGGAGMVLMPQPIFDAVDSLRKENSKVIMMTPQGKTYNQKEAYNLTKETHLIIICGHYEGFDERIRTIVDLELSIGDYVLTGGEIPAMVVVDSVARYIPNVLGNSSSTEDESFSNGFLEYPQYTRPAEFMGLKVPEVLLSGHHQNIEKWRKEESVKLTKKRRPDILK